MTHKSIPAPAARTSGKTTKPTATAETAARKRWAYAYQIIPPQSEARLTTVRTLIEMEMAAARMAARTWQGRFIPDQVITHILVVSDTPDQDAEANQRLEAALTELQAGFVRTTPLAVDEDVDLGPGGAAKLPPMLAPLIERHHPAPKRPH